MRAILLAAVAASLVATGCAQMGGMGGMGRSGWTTLIDGEKGLDNWNRVGDANWRAEGGAIVADVGKNAFLVSKESYRDFELRAEFWAATDTNSGIFIRCEDPTKITGALCWEVNIWDIRPELKYGTGAIVDLAEVPVPLKWTAGGRWNTYEIIAKGSEITIKLNGVTTAHTTAATKHPAGPFGLQMGPGVNDVQGGAIKWRKVEIRTL